MSSASDAPPGSDSLFARLLNGDMRAAARAMRVVDDRLAGYHALVAELYKRAGHAFVVGVTGTPGAGKSTLVDKLIESHRKAGRRVGVVAVDPTSPFSGGAILGDRIRMQRHFLDDGVFIRSLATRGHLGGLSRSAGDVVRVLDAFGSDVIILETVGVGQDELEVARLADTTIVVTAPGLGDDVQAIKAGILEIADVFVVNKADRDGADGTVRDLEQMIALGADTHVAGGHGTHHGHVGLDQQRADAVFAAGRWIPPVLKTVAARGDGVKEVVDACERHRAWCSESEQGKRRRRARREEEFQTIFREMLMQAVYARLGDALAKATTNVVDGLDDPFGASARLVHELGFTLEASDA